MSQPRKRKRAQDDEHATEWPARSDTDESEEEFEFENIELDNATIQGTLKVKDAQFERPIDSAIQISLPAEGNLRQRYPTAAIARKIRFEIHRAHLLCSLTHAAIRHYWIKTPEVGNALELLKSRLKGPIHPKSSSAQLQRIRVFRESLERISDLWSKSYKITRNGLRKAKWYTDGDTIAAQAASISDDQDLTRADMLHAAEKMEGDRDVGAQLLVAFLRMLDFECRLICSLQPLSLQASKVNLNTKSLQVAPQTISPLIAKAESHSDASRVRKLSRPQFGRSVAQATVIRPKVQVDLPAPIEDCDYPVYWTEVFDPAAQKWYPVDPLVTGTVDRPGAFEPPQTEDRNTLSYVVAINRDGSMQDVTYRYTNHFNAKIRRNRVEGVSEKAAHWWTRVLRYYRPLNTRDRDAIETAELAQKSLAEGIPANIGDLKNHPLFVIERHLRKHEIIHPRKDCGSIRIGKGQPVISEKVYPRKFVKQLRSAQAWYMKGRQLKPAQSPLKILSKRGNVPDQASGDFDERGSEALYSEEQTEQYIPLPVTNSIVPKNAYGHVDLFLPSMLPSGAVHFPSREAEAAAKLLEIDYAVAVTGFDHANRQSVPIKQGVVVAREFEPAMILVQTILEEERAFEFEQKTALHALERWSRFLRALRIRDHVETRYKIEEPVKDDQAGQVDRTVDQIVDSGGGFM